MTFTQADFEELTVRIYEDDRDQITAWLEEHVTTGREFYDILEILSMMIMRTWPLGASEGLVVDDNHGFALEPDGAPDEGSLVAAQILTAALNGDQDAIIGHCRAVVLTPEDSSLPFAVLAKLIAYYRFGLLEITPKEDA